MLFCSTKYILIYGSVASSEAQREYPILFLDIFCSKLLRTTMDFQKALCFIFVAHYSSALAEEISHFSNKNLVEVRAVFINCESDIKADNPDSEITRFQRQELFKHNALRDCNKKLALTVKMATEPEAGWTESRQLKDTNPGEDEYIPIDHVFEGSDRKRVRLLNPYILRLQREAPKQAYKLRRIDTISGILTEENSKNLDFNGKLKKQVRTKRNADDSNVDDFSLIIGSAAAVFPLHHDHDKPSRQSSSVTVAHLHGPAHSQDHRREPLEFTKTCEKRKVCLKMNNSNLVRDKRYKQSFDDMATSTRAHDFDNKSRSTTESHYKRNNENREARDYEIDGFEKTTSSNIIKPIVNTVKNKSNHQSSSKRASEKVKKRIKLEKEKRFSYSYDENYEEKVSSNFPGRDFVLYEIGNPDLWYTVKVQLFEKLSTPERKRVWNDLTQGDQASVSSANPEWKGRDLNLRYRSTEWVPRDDFTLPSTSLCLLEPLQQSNYSSFEDEPVFKEDVIQSYIVVPVDDIIGLRDINNPNKRNDNATNLYRNDPEVEEHRRVEIRVSRAIYGNSGENFAIAAHGEDKFLTLPHRRPHHAQIDLEVRADDNQLVRVGSSGRISTVVADNTRKTRTIISLQATNTGLASARFKAVALECGPELTSLMLGRDDVTAGPVVLPPHHTQTLRLEIPVEVPLDVTHCNVALVNDNEESVAVREVKIKKGDRCFCVWHCDCVCLSEDPKLLCNEMSQPQQAAAGLSTSANPRLTRSVCYPDDMVVNITGSVFGVVTLLLQLGLLKALVGLKCRKIGQWGLDKLLQMPRRLNCYYEEDLKKRQVVYDEAGWPVHPDTCERTVRVLSCPMEFLLNLIMFVALPSLLIFDLVRKGMAICPFCRKRTCKGKDGGVYSSQDMQSSSMELLLRRKRRPTLRDWMSPVAEEVTTDILQTGLLPQKLEKPRSPCCDEMQPLLHEMSLGSKSGILLSAVDSEQDDTEYVLMQMQKSRESLSKSQRKVSDFAVPSERNFAKGDNFTSASKR